jgi:heterodisulfide reductase subunit C
MLEEILLEYDLPNRARACYQCGVCAGGCPVGRFRWDFNPRRFMEMIIRGQLAALIRQESLWLCAHCLNCLEHCPQQIEVSEVITHVKNGAARLGGAPEGDVKRANLIMRRGWSEEPINRILKKRQSLGLPGVAVGIDPVELEALGRCLNWSAKMEAFERRQVQTKEAASEVKPLETE